MKYIYTFIFLFFSTALNVQAQQTIFNVPSTDVLDKGKVYVELDATFRFDRTRSVGKFSSFVPRVVVGASGDVEVGLNGQLFAAPGYFLPRPSAAGAAGYDAGASSGSNLGPTNQKLIDRVKADVEKFQAENPGKQIPIDMVTTSGSGLDPHISPANAEFQIPRIARERGLSDAQVREIVAKYTEGRQFGFLCEPRVNVLLMNLELDRVKPLSR